MEKDSGRLEVLSKIEEFEKKGLFDLDVEIDPPAKELKPNQIDYTRRKLSSKIKTKFAYGVARKFLNSVTKNGTFVVKEIRGGENFKNLQTGAIITCNHINPFDSFLMQLAYHETKQKKRKLFKVIKEANYTSFPGMFGLLMRNCYTLPLSSNRLTMAKFLEAIKEILNKGHYILIYPEQSMWWNYKKPRPLKRTAFRFAVENNVPVLPVFITMEDSDRIGADGFPIQEYTIHIDKPLYADESLNVRENAERLALENYKVWKRIYEEFYKEKLSYSTPVDKLPKEISELL